jgi:hypothetical protein
VQSPRLRTWSAVTAAGIGGVLLVLLGGLFAYLAGDHDAEIERWVIGTALVLVAVLTGAAIAIEAAKHHHHSHDEDDP